MKSIGFFFIVVLWGCKFHKENVPDDTSHYQMPSEKEINIKYDVYDVCSTYYFFAKDTLKPILSKVAWNDREGREREVRYISYESYIPATSLSFYDNSGKEISHYYRIDDSHDKGLLTKTLYYYDSVGNLSKTVAFDFRQRIKNGVDKGLGRPGGCIITEEDYEKSKSWAIYAIWNYKYNSQRKMTEKVASKINSTQNRYLYKYDANGRLLEEHSLEGDYAIWTEKYKYKDVLYEFTRTWFERDGTRRKDWNDSLTSVDTFRFKTDEKNNVIYEKVIEEGGRQISTDIKYYDTRNRIIRHEIYDHKVKLLGFYIHKYYTNSSPSSRNFEVTSR